MTKTAKPTQKPRRKAPSVDCCSRCYKYRYGECRALPPSLRPTRNDAGPQIHERVDCSAVPSGYHYALPFQEDKYGAPMEDSRNAALWGGWPRVQKDWWCAGFSSGKP